MKQMKQIAENVRKVITDEDSWLAMSTGECYKIRLQVRSIYFGFLPIWRTIKTDYVEELEA